MQVFNIQPLEMPILSKPEEYKYNEQLNKLWLNNTQDCLKLIVKDPFFYDEKSEKLRKEKQNLLSSRAKENLKSSFNLSPNTTRNSFRFSSPIVQSLGERLRSRRSKNVYSQTTNSSK